MKKNISCLTLRALAVLATLSMLAMLVSCSVPPKKESWGTISNAELRDKIMGSWIGQMVGVAWAAPVEFHYNGYIMPEDKVPVWESKTVNDAFGQDDLFVEARLLEAFEDHGLDATLDEIAPIFTKLPSWMCHANYQGRLNLLLGIEPEMAGHYLNNFHADDIDWQIEADFLGNFYPGMPAQAAQRAFEIGHLMNYGDGVYGGVFVAAMHAAAFMTNDLRAVINAGIQSVPENTKFRTVCEKVVECYDQGMAWEDAWQVVEDNWGTDDKCPEISGSFNIDAKLNAAYILIGLLWGKGDFEDTIVISMRCGQDSDCNPSNAAGILGTMYGFSGLPTEYTQEVDWFVGRFMQTKYSLMDCIDVSVELAQQALTASGATCSEDGVWSLYADNSVVAVPYEQWPDDVMTAYLELTAKEGTTVEIKSACVLPEDIRYSNITCSFDYGDGTVKEETILYPYLVSTHTYAQPGTYTVKMTATSEGYTATVERTVEVKG